MSRSILFYHAVVVLMVTAGTATADQWERSFQIAGKPTVHLHTNDGHIRVVTGTSNEITVRITAKGWDIGREVRVRDSLNGDRIEIEALVPNFQWSFGNRHRSLVIEVNVPVVADLELDSGDGALTVDGIRGSLRADTGDGDIDVDHVSGDLKLTSADGAITASGVDGSVFCKTSDGDIRVQGRFDGLHLESGDGDVRAKVENGSVLSEDWSIMTGDGSAILALPIDLVADIEAHTTDGSIDVDLPITLEGSHHQNHLYGHLNGGGPLLRIRSGDGRIHIKRS